MRSGIVALALLLSACRDEYSVQDAAYDPALLTSSGGEVALSDGGSFDFVITSDRYKQWDAARKGFSRSVSSRFGELLRPQAPTERTIARAVSYLESEAAARASIERAGMSVRDFVLMTVALEQQMRLATQRTAVPEAPAFADTFTADTARGDTSYLPGDLGPRYPYTPLPIDSARRVDTVYLPTPRDTAPRRDSLWPRSDTTRDTLRRRDSVRPPRDSMRPLRDTLRPARDTLPTPPRDTSPPPPSDTLPAPADSVSRG